MPRPEAREKLPNPQNEFDLSKDLLGPNLRLRDQLPPEQREFFEKGSSALLATFYPHSTLGPQGIVATGEIYADCYKVFGLERIAKISQLGEIALLPDELSVMSLDYQKSSQAIVSTSRWLHSLTVAVVLELMLRNNAFSEREIKKGITAALLHDAAIFPFSDLAVIDPKFNEDENLPLYFGQIDGAERKNFEKKYAVACSEIPKIARGKGVLGAFLKIADRLAYTAYDSINFFVILQERRRRFGKGENPLEEILDIFADKPNLFDIFREVKLDSQNALPYFENSEDLAAFLRVRGLMQTYVYLNPERLAFQAVVRSLIHDLSENGKINLAEFLRMTDLDFASRYSVAIAWKEAHDKVGFLRCESGKDLERVLAGASGLPKPPDFIWAEKVSGFDTLTHLQARDPKDRRIKPFSQICPKETAGLSELNRQTQGIVAYYLKE